MISVEDLPPGSGWTNGPRNQGTQQPLGLPQQGPPGLTLATMEDSQGPICKSYQHSAFDMPGMVSQ